MAKIKNIVSKFLNDSKYMLVLSAAAAVVVWFYAAGVYSPETNKTLYGVPLDVSFSGTAAEQTDLMILKGLPKVVEIEVNGNRIDLATLDVDRVSAGVDLSTITEPGEYLLPVKVKLPIGSLSVSTVTPAEVKVKIARVKTVGVSIGTSVQGKVKEGYAIESIKSAPSIIKVTGPEDIVNTISEAAADPIDVSLATDSVTKMLDFTLKDRDKNTVDMTNITTDVSQTSVTVTVYKSKRVPLTATVINTSGGMDESFATVTVTPAEIDIVGGLSTIEAINNINLGSVDMADAGKEGKTVEMDIVLPNGVKGLGITNAKATVKVTYPELATKTYNISSFSFSAQSNKTITVRPINVTVRGLPDDISRLTEADIKAVVLLDDVNTTGQIQLPVTFEFPVDYKVSVQGAYKASVTIR